MAIAKVQGNARGTATSGTTIPVTMASTPVSGNILVAAIGTLNNVGYMTVSSISQTGVTWTLQKQKQLYSGNKWYYDVEIWFGVVAAGASTAVTVNLSGSQTFERCAADICEYSGVATTSFLDVTASNSGSAAATDTGTAATTQADELWIGAVLAGAVASTSTQGTPTNSFILYDGAVIGVFNTASLVLLEKIVTATGNANSGTTAAGTMDGWAGCIATFKAPAGLTAGSKDLSSSVTIRKAASKAVSSSFTIRKSSTKALSSSITVRNKDTKALSTSFTVRNKGSKPFSSSFTIKKSSSKALSNSFTCRKAASKALSSSWTIRKSASKALSSSFTIRKSSSKALSSSFTIRKTSTVALSSSITLRKASTKTLSSSFTVRKAGYKQLSSSITVRNASSKALSSSVTIRKSSSKVLSSSFSVRKSSSQDLSSNIIIRKSDSKAVSSSITIQKTGSQSSSSSFIIRKQSSINLSSSLQIGTFFIESVICDPLRVQRSGTNTTELRCDWHDEADLALTAYTCRLYVRGPTPNQTVYGPFTGTGTKEGSKEYHAVYSWDPPAGADLGLYDLQAEVIK